MFRCCSPETSHPCLLPQSPKDCSINLCLFFCSAYRVIINIFLNSIYKIYKLLTRLNKEKRKKNQINKIKNEKGEVATDNAEIKTIIRDYYEQLYGNKIYNLEEMERFLEKFNLPTLKQEEIEIMNNPNTSTKIEAVIKNLPKHKSPGPNGFTGKFYQTFREKLMPMLLKLFQKIAEEGTVPNSFYKATLIPKPCKDNTKRENYKPILLMNIDAKILNKNFSIPNSVTHQKAHTP